MQQSRNSANGHYSMEDQTAASNNGRRQSLPTPLFERLVTEEVQELKAYARIIENQNRRLLELERVHGDLETRLELESKGRAQLETTLEEREREWATRFKELEVDRDQWRKKVNDEKDKNKRLVDQVVRKDQDIHRMLQRKYDKKGDSPSSTHSIRNVRQLMNDRKPGASSQARSMQEIGAQRGGGEFKSPHEILAASGSMEAVRTRNVQNLLTEFFAI